jgi:hypothetical protein
MRGHVCHDGKFGALDPEWRWLAQRLVNRHRDRTLQRVPIWARDSIY